MSFPSQPTILIVDDDGRLRDLTAAAAERTRCFGEILLAEHGAAALDLLGRKERVDVVLTDLSMPELDGLELTKNILADARWRDIPVVMFSSSNRPNDREQALAAGCRMFFEKPDTLGGLENVLRTAADLAQDCPRAAPSHI